MISPTEYTCGTCGFHCEGSMTPQLMQMHPALCVKLTKEELTLIYKFLETMTLPYDNYELHHAVEKLRRIVEANELDK